MHIFLGMLETIGHGKEESVIFYNNWVRHVKKVVPPDRLLIFEVKQGWEPLCRFLELPVPDELFPRVNDTAEIMWNFKKLKIMAYVTLWGIPSILSIVVSYTYLY